MIRIIGGEFRHRTLKLPADPDICRPTMDKVREAVFSSLREDVPACHFLDLFAGSGAVGLEALSRGAAKVVFNEKDSKIIRVLTENIRTFDPNYEKCVSLKKDWSDALIQLARKNDVFDVVYLDPPYALDINPQIIARMSELGLLAPDAVVVAEQNTPLAEIDGFVLKAKKYGKKNVGIYRRKIDA